MDGYAYRCPLCRTTSTPARTESEAKAARAVHRRDFHGGHIPDGEQIIAPDRMRWADVPSHQKIATLVVALVLILGVLIKTG